ncbi:substrate-binding domain-containing protein [Saccharothrix sp. HUAS TT1]|uniref:substrate-binding domain-containing protein n=1 Tax=unclassified Saccharothrix TaxID=2593673 RepID=UPI00345BB897
MAATAQRNARRARVVVIGLSLGLRVGADVAVTGFDGGAVGLVTEPTLTSARIPFDRVSRELVDRCPRQVEHGPDGEPGVVLPAELVRGGSA